MSAGAFLIGVCVGIAISICAYKVFKPKSKHIHGAY